MPNWLPVQQENRAIQYVVSDTRNPGVSETFSILTPADCGFGPQWMPGAYAGAMAVPAAYRASTLIAGLIGAMPLHAFRERAGKPVERLTPTPALLADPSPPSTRIDVISSWLMDYLFHGNSIGVFASRNAEGFPTSVVPVPADKVGCRWNHDTGRAEYDITGRLYTSDEVFHVRAAHAPGALRGLGILEAALGTFSLAREQQRQAAGLAYHGVPTGVLTTTNPDVQHDDLVAGKAAWLEAQSTRTVAALAPGMSFQPISWNPEEMQLHEAQKMSDQRIAQLFGLPLRYLGSEVGGLTYSNPTLDAVDLLKFTVDQHLERFEQELSRHLPHGTWAKFNRDAVLRADTKARYDSYAVALTAGFLEVGEVRDLEDLPPLDEDPLEAPPEAETEADPEAETEPDPTPVEDPGGVPQPL